MMSHYCAVLFIPTSLFTQVNHKLKSIYQLQNRITETWSERGTKFYANYEINRKLRNIDKEFMLFTIQ